MNVCRIQVIILPSAGLDFILIYYIQCVNLQTKCEKPKEIKPISIFNNFCNLICYTENENKFFIDFVITVKCM